MSWGVKTAQLAIIRGEVASANRYLLHRARLLRALARRREPNLYVARRARLAERVQPAHEPAGREGSAQLVRGARPAREDEHGDVTNTSPGADGPRRRALPCRKRAHEPVVRPVPNPPPAACCPPGTSIWPHNIYSHHLDPRSFAPYTAEFWPERWLLAAGDLSLSDLSALSASGPRSQHRSTRFERTTFIVADDRPILSVAGVLRAITGLSTVTVSTALTTPTSAPESSRPA
ncbi:hypothetical protein LXA43DRAFT_1156097 [Ganoderma leucocontextum]|nr:hypothetical protein LXA43DRAFT_1156097 [Ganoderma leucocontextum]